MCQAQKYKHTCKLHLPVNLSLENLLFIKSFFKKNECTMMMMKKWKKERSKTGNVIFPQYISHPFHHVYISEDTAACRPFCIK